MLGWFIAGLCAGAVVGILFTLAATFDMDELFTWGRLTPLETGDDK